MLEDPQRIDAGVEVDSFRVKGWDPVIRIESLQIANFRALKEMNVAFHPMTTIIGENDVGKSSCMFALRTFFESRKIDRRADIFMGDTGLQVQIAVVFSVASPTEAQARYVTGGRLRLRATYVFGEQRGLEACVKQPKDERFANLGAKNVGELRKILADVTGDSSVAKLLKDDARSTLEAWVDQNVTEFTTAWSTLSEKEFATVLPDFILVPVARDIDSNVKMTDSSLFGRLFRPILRAVLSESEVEPSLTGIRGALQTGALETVTRLQDLMREQMNNPSITLTHSVDLDPIKGIEFEFGMDDERAAGIPLSNRGAGVHNNLILGMFRLLAERAATDFILAIEEPENSLHPRGQREMLWALQNLSKTAQVICTTHSSVFLDLGSLEDNIVLTRTPQGNTVARSFSPEDYEGLREIMGIRISDALLSGGGNCALIVEGHTELHAYPWLFQMAGMNHRELGISIVPAGGSDKKKIWSLLRVLECYRIPVIVVLDKDAESHADDLRRSIGAPGFGNLKEVFCLRQGQFEQYIPLEIAVRIINERYPDGPDIAVSDIQPDKDREAEFQRVMHVKRKPGARFQHFKVQFGELAGRAMYSEGSELPDEFRAILERARSIATAN